jgi:uncharacterized membrane protein YkvA (DUF1232 family)
MALFAAYKASSLSSADLESAGAKAVKLKERATDFGLMVDMAKDVMFGHYKMNKWNISIIVGTVVYVLSPLDAIPDIIPVAGWLDDITIVGYALGKLSEEIKKYKEFLER